MNAALDTGLLERLSGVVGGIFGLQYNRERWGDLERGILSAAKTLDAGAPEDFAQALLHGPISHRTFDALAQALTIGETYFFRDEGLFQTLSESFLPELIRKRRDAGLLVLRFWSAGCCTGEEPYSLAMVLNGLLPDIDKWNISIVGTDLNPAFLDKARQGVYGEWSMRVLPPALRGVYFDIDHHKRYRIRPAIKGMVKFFRFNLAQEVQPGSMAHLQSMDLILCRNVLMYMSPHRAESILSMLGKCLSEEGLIALAPVEASLARNLPLRSGAYGHACLLRSRPVTASGHAPEHFTTPAASPVKLQPIVASTRTARSKRNKSLHPERENAGPDSEGTGERRGEEAAPSSLLRKAREFADHGRLEEALTSAVNAFEDSGEAEAGFLVATVLREMGQDEEAIRRLEDLVAAHQDFVLAHFTLGTLLQRNQKVDAALGHYYEALRLLEHREPDSILPGTSGEMTAGHMLRLVSSLLERKARR